MNNFKLMHHSIFKNIQSSVFLLFNFLLWYNCIYVVLAMIYLLLKPKCVIFFSKKFFWRTYVLFVGPLITLFWTSSDVTSEFQSQSDQPYLHLAEVYMLHIPWDSHLVWNPLTLGSQHGSQVISSTYLQVGIVSFIPKKVQCNGIQSWSNLVKLF